MVFAINGGMNRQLYKVALAKLNLPGCAIARQLGIDRATMSRIVNGWDDPPVETKQKLAVALKVAVSELFPDENEKIVGSL